MTYLLNPNVILRGWHLIPMAYCKRGEGRAQKLSPEEWSILRKCDGETDIPSSPLLDTLLAHGVCAPAESNQKLAEWQRYRFCDCRYFPAVNWAITSRCNFNCRHCFNAADNLPLTSEFTFEQSMDFIRQLDECGVQNVNLTGGEPTLHPHFMDICREIESRGMTVTEVTTNGSLITPGILNELASFHTKPLFKLSFDGVGHHDWLRMKEGAEQSVVEKSQLLLDKGFKVRWQTNVHRANLDSILPTVRLAEQMGIELIRIIRTSESPRWTTMGGDFCLTIEEYYDFALKLTEAYIAENLKINVDIWQVIQYWGGLKLYHNRPVEGGFNVYRDNLPVCRANRRLIAVTAAGDLLPCNQMSGYFLKHDIHIGNIFHSSLKSQLTESRYLDSVCCTVGQLKEENPDCQVCPHWKLCMGGCRGFALVLCNDYKKHDPTKCLYFNNYMERFAVIFGKDWRCIDDL